MPDGSSTKSTFKNKILHKIFSFFKFKSQNNLKNQASADVEEQDPFTKYQHTEAKDLMIPRVDIIAINYEQKIDEIASIFLQHYHTRMPVFKNNLDNIVGYLNIKDILPYLLDSEKKEKFDISNVIRKLLVISPSMKIHDLLEKMRQAKTHIAMVVDELGGADGLITIEDLVEELIGEIDDEFDQECAEEFKLIGQGKFLVSGRLEIDRFESKLGIELDKDDSYETVGGMILSYLGRIPAQGEKFTHEPTGMIFEITKGNERKIDTVTVTII